MMVGLSVVVESHMSDKGVPRQLLVSKDGENDTDVLGANFEASRLLAETVRSSLGPKGLDKMLVSSDGTVVVTNDGASILDRLDISHPAAKLIAEVADQQDVNAGDGTTSAVLLAGELLAEAASLREKGVHPTTIARGYHLARSRATEFLSELTVPFDPSDDEQLRDVARTVVTGKWDKAGTEFLAERAVETIRAIERENRIAFEKITRKTIPGGSFYDSEVVNGLVIDLEESSTDVVSPEGRIPRRVQGATVALIDQEMSIDNASGVGAVNPETSEDYAAFRSYEQRVYEEYVDAVAGVGADVLFCQQSIDGPVRYGLADEGILAVERTRRDEFNKLARATGAQTVTVENLSSATVGRATSVERRPLGSTEIAVVSGFQEFDQVSLLFRGGTEHVAEETRRKLDDCFYVLKLAIEDQALLPGGGATEAAVAHKLRRQVSTYPGREQLAIEAFASAVETIPRTLAASAGMDPIDAIVELRNAHDKGEHTIGLNLDTGDPVDMTDVGVYEPLHVKRRVLSSAVDATNMVIRIDDALSVTGQNHDTHGQEHDHDHAPGGVVQSTDGYPWAVGHSMGHDH